MANLTLHHDYQQGTTVRGTVKNSLAHHTLKEHPSWIWSRATRSWLLRSSRHRQSKPHALDEIERLLSELGYTVQRNIDDAMPPVSAQETDRASRSAIRERRLTERAQHHADNAEATRGAADRCFPNNGQPLLTDHHSYAADKNRRELGNRLLQRARAQDDYANELARQADAAAHDTGARYHPITVANRIDTYQAIRRRHQRELDDGESRESGTDSMDTLAAGGQRACPAPERAAWLRREITTIDEHIAYWTNIYAQLQTDGIASNLGPGNVAVGDWVQHARLKIWMRVRRVNQKSASVPNPNLPTPQLDVQERTRTVPWYKLTSHRTTEQMNPEYVDAYETPGTDRMSVQHHIVP